MTNDIKGVIYDPPGRELPYLAVVFDAENQVLIVRAVPSRRAGEALISSAFEDAAKAFGSTLSRE